MQAKQLEVLSKLKGLNGLTIECLEITDGQANQLKVLKNLDNLKFFSLRFMSLSPETVQKLKAALTQVADFQFVSESSREDQLTKLKKQKLIAAIKSLQALYDKVIVGTGVSDLDRRAQVVKDATIDLNDRELTNKIADDYVHLLERAHTIYKGRFDAGIKDGGSAADYYPILHAYLDAQIWQLTLKKSE